VSPTVKILRYRLREVVRGRTVLGYGLFFAAATLGLIRFGGGIERALPSLASLVLLVIPLVALVVGTIFVYEGRDFSELVLTQPVGRRPLFLGSWLGITLPLIGAFLLGAGGPLLLSGVPPESLRAVVLLLVTGALLTAVFTALAFWVATAVADTARGLGLALVTWLALTVVYDGVVLLAAGAFAAYPLEKALLALMILNPVDLARILVLLALDASVLMGYTGAVFRAFFGSAWGMAIALLSLGAWIALPLLWARRRFVRSDL
jgi:Cu-processing system permease protein